MLWIQEIQKSLRQNKNFDNWKQQFDVYEDEAHVLRCRGRLANSSLPDSTKFPILLDSHHHLTSLIVRDCHKRVMHSGTKATLTELRSRFWIIKGRQFIRRLIHGCVTCRRYDCKPYDPAPAPQLPVFRVTENPPFSHIGIDFAGPLYVKTSDKDLQQKVWICLFTCCTSRAVHLELVPDLHTSSFLRCFQRFTSRRGVPVKILSDNGKTFIAAAKHFEKLSKDPDFNYYLQGKGIHWSFNLEKAPWWGGIFERLIKSTKRCLKKTVGRAKLTYEELETVLIEAESVLNSRPLSYVSTEDVEEPLTPFHLLYGRRVTNLPEVKSSTNQDPDYEPTHNEITRKMVYLQNTINHFWERWKTEYLLELRSTHLHGPQGSSIANIGDVVIIQDQDHPRGQWKLGKIEQLIKGNDDQTRGAIVRVHSKDGKTRTLRRPVQHLYPMEIQQASESEELQADNRDDEADDKIPNEEEPQQARPKRAAAEKANKRRQSWINDL